MLYSNLFFYLDYVTQEFELDIDMSSKQDNNDERK